MPACGKTANVVEAPTLQFDREHRTIFAQGFAQGMGQGEINVETGLRPFRAGQSPAPTQALAQPVSTVLVQVDKNGAATPVRITSARLNYTDAERRIFLDGGVTTKASDATDDGTADDGISAAA